MIRAGVSTSSIHLLVAFYFYRASLSTGIFAAQNIPPKTFVGIYAGEYLTDDEGEERGEYVDTSVTLNIPD